MDRRTFLRRSTGGVAAAWATLRIEAPKPHLPGHFPEDSPGIAFWLGDERLKAHCMEEKAGPEFLAMRVWGELQVHLVNVPQRGLELVTRRLIEDEPARYRYDLGLLSFRGTARLVEVKPSVLRWSGDEDAFEVNARFLILGEPVLEEIPYVRPARPRRESLEEIPDIPPACPRRDSIIRSTRLWRAAEKSWAQDVEI